MELYYPAAKKGSETFCCHIEFFVKDKNFPVDNFVHKHKKFSYTNQKFLMNSRNKTFEA
jgi:hypothetical protein